MTIWICRWRMNTLVTSQYQPRLSSITKICSRRISQSDWSIQIKLNYYLIVYNYCIYICTVLYDLIKLSQFWTHRWQDMARWRRDTSVPTYYVSSYFDYFLLWYHRDLYFHVRKQGPSLHTRGVGSWIGTDSELGLDSLK